MNPTHPTPDTPTPPGMVCAAEHPTDGYMCTRPVGHGGNHAAEEGTIVYKRWPIDPPVPPNPCALEDVPDGAEVAEVRLHDIAWVPVGERRRVWHDRTAVWWRWPEPKGLTFPDDPTSCSDARTASGEGVSLFANESTAGLYLMDHEGDEASTLLTTTELRSLRDRCDTVLAHIEGQS